jgi:hypothetical protein
MEQQVCAGIDYGALRLHVGYATENGPTMLPQTAAASRPLVLFDPTRSISSLGVGFPSVLHSVGVGTPFLLADQRSTPEALVSARLKIIAERLYEASGSEPGATAFAVPAGLSQTRRHALLDCAKASGFASASLLERSIAVALGTRRENGQPGTFLVFHLDYSDCEYALVRLGRGRSWMVGSGLAPNISGELLNALVMEDMILALRHEHVFLGLRSLSPAQWHDFRSVAEAARNRFGRKSTTGVRIGPQLAGAGTTISVEFSSPDYARAVRQRLQRTMEGIDALLDGNDLDRSGIDGLYLTGDASTSFPVADFFGSCFPGKVFRVHDDAIALGATIHAAEIAGRKLNAHAGMLTPIEGRRAILDGPEAESTGAPGTAQFTTVARIDRPDAAPAASSFASPAGSGKSKVQEAARDRLEQANLMASQGRYAEAEELISAVAREVETLREQIRKQASTAAPLSEAEQYIRRAQAMLIDGLYFEAVRLAHLGYAEAPHEPAILTAMMKVHADAALGMAKPEQYTDAINILTCAHGHDPTNKGIHKALADRHLLQALTLFRLNNFERALEATRAALTFDPKRSEAHRLLAMLTDTASGPEEEKT